VSEMTYNLLAGTLSPTHSLTHSLIANAFLLFPRCRNRKVNLFHLGRSASWIYNSVCDAYSQYDGRPTVTFPAYAVYSLCLPAEGRPGLVGLCGW